MTLQQRLLTPRGVANVWGWGLLSPPREEYFIGDEAPGAPSFPAMPSIADGTTTGSIADGTTTGSVMADDANSAKKDHLVDLRRELAHAMAYMQMGMRRAELMGLAGLAAGLLALVTCVAWSLSAPPGEAVAGPIGRTELAFDYFEQTLKMWNSTKTAETFSEDVRVRFYNQGTKEEKIFLGRSGAIELLEYATGLGCAKLQDTVVVREVDEDARMVYITWEYPKAISNFCGPSGEMYMFDSNYKISRLNALVNWRVLRKNATAVAFDHFERMQEAWDLEETAKTFADDAVIRFHNLGTDKEEVFKGRAGAKELLVYAQELGCAKFRDTVTVREVDEEARMVYISWKYPASELISNFCKPSTEVYTFDQDYKISRLNTIVNWRTPRANPTRDAFNNFHTVLKTWDFARTAETFSPDAVITFYNQGTKELKNFQGRLGAIELLVYATSLPCAKMHDDITVMKVDEAARTVYTAWEYPPGSNSSGRCGASGEMYMFSEDYQILRLNALVDWSS